MLIEKELKTAVKKVNKLQQKGSISREILVYVCDKWVNDPCFVGIKQVLEESEIKIISARQSLPNTMTFARYTTRQYDFDAEIWNPCLPQFEYEPYILVYMKAEEFALLCLDEKGPMPYFLKLMSKPSITVILVIENLFDYYKRKKLAVQRSNNDALRCALGENSIRRSTQLKDNFDNLPDRSKMEAELLYLQVFSEGRVKIHPTDSAVTGNWILSFIEQIALFPEVK